jgi:hypothetical protein
MAGKPRSINNLITNIDGKVKDLLNGGRALQKAVDRATESVEDKKEPPLTPEEEEVILRAVDDFKTKLADSFHTLNGKLSQTELGKLMTDIDASVGALRTANDVARLNAAASAAGNPASPLPDRLRAFQLILRTPEGFDILKSIVNHQTTGEASIYDGFKQGLEDIVMFPGLHLEGLGKYMVNGKFTTVDDPGIRDIMTALLDAKASNASQGGKRKSRKQNRR